jgi:hypothetical protein
MSRIEHCWREAISMFMLVLWLSKKLDAIHVLTSAD